MSILNEYVQKEGKKTIDSTLKLKNIFFVKTLKSTKISLLSAF